MSNSLRRIALGISGGVDSAVAAYLLSQKGFEVTGLFMRNWDKQEEDMCQLDGDRDDAEMVCRHLGIPFKEVNFVKEYWLNVFEYFLESYKSGRTPNPDVLCNRFVKFDAFYERAKQMGFDAIATGHYARTSFADYLEDYDENKLAKLLRCSDPRKDQTFFLCRIPQKALRRTMFPLSRLLKSEVKQIAQQIGLQKIVTKRQSDGICFIGRRNLSGFLDKFIEPSHGACFDIDTGEELKMKHRGIHKHTIGQRIECRRTGERYYVVDKNISKQALILCRSNLHGALYCSTFYVNDLYWFSGTPPAQLSADEGQKPYEAIMRWQHVKPKDHCTLKRMPDGTIQVNTVVPQRAITPGQFAVFYDTNDVECLGSGEICARGPSLYDQQLQVSQMILDASRRPSFDVGWRSVAETKQFQLNIAAKCEPLNKPLLNTSYANI